MRDDSDDDLSEFLSLDELRRLRSLKRTILLLIFLFFVRTVVES
jgi:hypothetical protein